MMTGFSQFGPMEMGGMFSVVKVREGLAANDYTDPGCCQHHQGTCRLRVARRWCSANGSAAPHPRQRPNRAAIAQMVDGEVIKVDESTGKITIKHGPMPKFDMGDGMTMVFRANDPAILKQVKAGDKNQVRSRQGQWPVHGQEGRERKQ
jgi:Cu/Ag efflux protein CusF